MEEPVQIMQFFLCLFLFNWNSFASGSEIEELSDRPEFKIEGKVYVASKDKEWTMNSRVLVDGGQYLGFVRTDGTFVVHGVPSGSYIVEIANPNALFEALRVDITSKGKIRARRVNFLQPNLVKVVNYPLEFRERGRPNYFHRREQWRLTDFLFNPMVLTMIVPLLLIMVLPKLMNAADADTQKDDLNRELSEKANVITRNERQSLQKVPYVNQMSEAEHFSQMHYDGLAISRSSKLTSTRLSNIRGHTEIKAAPWSPQNCLKVKQVNVINKRQKRASPSKKMLALSEENEWQNFQKTLIVDQSGVETNVLCSTKTKEHLPMSITAKPTQAFLDVRTEEKIPYSTSPEHSESHSMSGSLLESPSVSCMNLSHQGWELCSMGSLSSTTDLSDSSDSALKDESVALEPCMNRNQNLSDKGRKTEEQKSNMQLPSSGSSVPRGDRSEDGIDRSKVDKDDDVQQELQLSQDNSDAEWEDEVHSISDTDCTLTEDDITNLEDNILDSTPSWGSLELEPSYLNEVGILTPHEEDVDEPELEEREIPKEADGTSRVGNVSTGTINIHGGSSKKE